MLENIGRSKLPKGPQAKMANFEQVFKVKPGSVFPWVTLNTSVKPPNI